MVISALPLDHCTTSAGIASMREVGLDSGKIIGRSQDAVIASTTSWVNAPNTVEEPSRMVGDASLIASTNPTRSPAATPEPLVRFFAYGTWKSRRSSMSSNSRPCLSIGQICDAACSTVAPSATIASRI